MADLDWLEISVTTDSEAAEAVVELFNRFGWGNAVVETPIDCFEYELNTAPRPSSVIVKTYLPLDEKAAQARQRIEEGLWHLGRIYPIPDPVVQQLAEEDWTQAWKKQYHLLRVGQRTVIVPDWEHYDPLPGEVVIRLEPGMAFGTGLHPTTRLCLAALERNVAADARVLDVGTGSGILAIAAAKLGAGMVLAVDANEQAVRTAQENVLRNGVEDQVNVGHGSLAGGERVPAHFAAGPLNILNHGTYDLIAINILAPVIIAMAPSVPKHLAPGGKVVLAGLIESQEQAVEAAMASSGLVCVDRAQEEDWVSLVVQRG